MIVSCTRKTIALLFCVIMMFSFTACRERNYDDGLVSMPLSSDDMKDRQYEDIITKLGNAGFVNIHEEPMDDLIIGLLNKDGAVDEVTVDGKNNFRKNARYEPDAYIVVRYHSFSGNGESNVSDESVESEEPVIADTSDGMISIPVSSEDIKNLSVNSAVDILTDAGFVNVKVQPLGDLIVGIVYSDGEIMEVSVDGDIEFKKGDRYIPGAKIIIRYHSY